MNPAEWLKRTAMRAPQAVALLQADALKASYSDFNRAAAGFGAALREQGIGKGSRVAVFMSNRVEYLIALYGIWYAGAAAVPINAKLHAKEAEWIIRDAGACLLISDDSHAPDLAALLTNEAAGLLSADGGEFAEMCTCDPLLEPIDLEPSDLLWLFYTSGTTGRPKGVMITCAMIASMSYNYFVDVDSVSAEDAILYAAPMSHGAGLYNFMHVMKGARHVVPSSGGFDPREIFALGKSVDNVSMFAAPTMVR
ncbi:MAG: AMP-binding protein, partial [Planktotalea sp.]|uniref:AMP-binding protein n=1 Tax=Planktotalea sp. TaxID=2029877 RepID=UPI003C76E361